MYNTFAGRIIVSSLLLVKLALASEGLSHQLLSCSSYDAGKADLIFPHFLDLGLGRF
jgi:hypothetical protein